ncbi:hypothetical protein AnigIFM50267_007932 [Aspergillus niger]|nr:hypothetical protein AnigIFM50267_007932 [Aspergillus niger]
MSTLLTPLALVGWMGRAWDTDYTAPDKLPHATGLGWADGTGLGQQHATHNTAHQRTWPHGWVDGTGLGYRVQHATQCDNTSGPMVGWMGRAWVINTQLDNTTRRDNIPGPMVGWLGWAWDNSTQLDNTTQ